MSPRILLLLAFLAALPVAAQEQQFADLGTCDLENGEELRDCRVGFRTLGTLNVDRDKAILIPSWYGGNTVVWVYLHADLLGQDHGYFVILVDALANGVSVSPSNSEAQPGDAFPEITTRDMVRSQYRLVTEVLELDGLVAVMGVSMGGMQTFEWGVLYPDFMRKLIPIAGSPKLAGHDVALWEAYKRLFQWSVDCQCDEAAEALTAVRTLDAGTATNLIRQADAMMATDVTRSFGDDWAEAARAVRAEMLVIVAASDPVVTPSPAVDFAGLLGDRATLIVMETDCGHGIPECEMFRSRSLIREFLRSRGEG